MSSLEKKKKKKVKTVENQKIKKNQLRKTLTDYFPFSCCA